METAQCFHLAYGIRILILEVFVRNNRVKTFRAQQSPWHLWAMVNIQSLSFCLRELVINQSFVESKFHLPLKKMKRKLEVPRVHERVVQKVELNFLCPATRGVHEKFKACAILRDATWAKEEGWKQKSEL